MLASRLSALCGIQPTAAASFSSERTSPDARSPGEVQTHIPDQSRVRNRSVRQNSIRSLRSAANEGSGLRTGIGWRRSFDSIATTKRRQQHSPPQASRLEIAMVLAGGPDLLLLDEPTAGMAEETLPRRSCATNSTGRQPVVEHDMAFVREIAHRVMSRIRGGCSRTARSTR